jgi:Protein of unknown function (DUF1499)
LHGIQGKIAAANHLLHPHAVVKGGALTKDTNVMMRREYIREPSKAAHSALPPAVFSIVLGFVSTIAHRSDLLSTQNFLLVLTVTFAVAGLSFLLSLIGLYAVWARAAKGGKRSGWALLLSLPVLGVGLLAVALLVTTAPLSDISTDTLDPPHFSVPVNSADGANVNEPPRLDRQIQSTFYPFLTGRRYALTTETIVGRVMRQMADNGWVLLDKNARSIGDGEWVLEATVKTPAFGFIDFVVVRVTDEGDATYVDMRSAAKFGRYDLGGNARRINEFMKKLDIRVSQQSQ